MRSLLRCSSLCCQMCKTTAPMHQWSARRGNRATCWCTTVATRLPNNGLRLLFLPFQASLTVSSRSVLNSLLLVNCFFLIIRYEFYFLVIHLAKACVRLESLINLFRLPHLMPNSIVLVNKVPRICKVNEFVNQKPNGSILQSCHDVAYNILV